MISSAAARQRVEQGEPRRGLERRGEPLGQGAGLLPAGGRGGAELVPECVDVRSSSMAPLWHHYGASASQMRHVVPAVASGPMALLHKATISPPSSAALSAWLPGRSWLDGADVGTLSQLGAYRFDDPAGAVGIETLLVSTGDGRLVQVPLSYRAAPLAGAEDALVTTMQHSVLGPRWAYDGCADPVAMRALAAAILTGGHEAELEIDTGAGLERREPTVRVIGSGTPPAAVPRRMRNPARAVRPAGNPVRGRLRGQPDRRDPRAAGGGRRDGRLSGRQPDPADLVAGTGRARWARRPGGHAGSACRGCADAGDEPDPDHACLSGPVRAIDRTGRDVYLTVQVGAHRLVARFAGRSRARVGEVVTIAVDAARAHVFDRETGRALYHPDVPT